MIKPPADFACGVVPADDEAQVERPSCFIVSQDESTVYYIITGIHHGRREARSFQSEYDLGAISMNF